MRRGRRFSESTWKRRAIRWVLAMMAITASAGFAVSGAQADALGCTHWGGFSFGGHSFSAGQYCFGVNGSGRHITRTTGSYNTPVLYNWYEQVQLYDAYGNRYGNFHTRLHTGRYFGSEFWSTNIHGTAKPGRICGTLWSSGDQVATACESIY